MLTLNTKIALVGIVLCSFVYCFSYIKSVIAADIIATITTGIFVPFSPVNLAATIDDQSVDLSWSPPLSNGGDAITDYVIEYRLSSGGIWVVFPDGVSAGTSAQVTGLANDNAYDFRVFAVNGIGQGPASSVVSVTPGSPAQVLILGFSDLTAPSIVSNVRITNEGSAPYEYQYTWCVTNSDSNLCGGGNDIFGSSAAKLIQSGEDWDTALSAVVATPGTYWLHLEVHFGSETSYASQSFTAISEPSSGGGSGGGGGGSRRSNQSVQCVGPDLNNDKKVTLTDVSILFTFFGKNPPFKNSCADINLDGAVNLTDFSILLHQWGKKPVPVKKK